MKKKLLFHTIVCLLLMSFFLDSNGAEAKNNIRLSKDKIVLKKGETYKLKLYSAKSKNVKWNSTNKKIASVKKGTIKAKKGGTCYITAKYKKMKYRCKVVVKNDPVKEPIVPSSPLSAVTLVVNSFNEADGTIRYSITNTSEKEISIPSYFVLERLEDGRWITISKKNEEVTAEAMVLMPGVENTIEANLFVIYGLLENGKYRIVIPAVETVYSSEFEIWDK